MCPRASKTPPRTSKTPSGAPKTPPRASMTPQGPAGCVLGASIHTVIPEGFCSWRADRQSWRYLSCLGLQDASTSLQDGSKNLQDASNWFQERLQDAPKRLEDRSVCPQRPSTTVFSQGRVYLPRVVWRCSPAKASSITLDQTISYRFFLSFDML